jgi:hypothetical protein
MSSSEQPKELWMKPTETAAAVNYPRWARDTASARRLRRAPRQVLLQLGLRADRSGRCHPSVARIAEDAGYSVPATKRALAELERLKLVSSQRRGRRSAIRQLCVDAPMPAPPCPRGTMPLFDADLAPAADLQPPVPVVALAPPEVSSAPPEVSPATPRSTQEEVVEEETRAARADTTFTDPSGVLAARLGEVLEILEPAIGAIIEPLSFNSALAAFPEERGHDHVQAAHIVASYGFEGELRSPVSLLRQVLRNQLRSAQRTDRWHDGRRRGGAPLSDEVQAQIDKENAGMNLLLERMGWGQLR